MIRAAHTNPGCDSAGPNKPSDSERGRRRDEGLAELAACDAAPVAIPLLLEPLVRHECRHLRPGGGGPVKLLEQGGQLAHHAVTLAPQGADVRLADVERGQTAGMIVGAGAYHFTARRLAWGPVTTD